LHRLQSSSRSLRRHSRGRYPAYCATSDELFSELMLRTTRPRRRGSAGTQRPHRASPPFGSEQLAPPPSRGEKPKTPSDSIGKSEYAWGSVRDMAGWFASGLA
jgi:hypothetical protein